MNSSSTNSLSQPDLERIWSYLAKGQWPPMILFPFEVRAKWDAWQQAWWRRVVRENCRRARARPRVLKLKVDVDSAIWGVADPEADDAA